MASLRVCAPLNLNEPVRRLRRSLGRDRCCRPRSLAKISRNGCMVSTIVIETKIRVFQQNRSKEDSRVLNIGGCRQPEHRTPAGAKPRTRRFRDACSGNNSRSAPSHCGQDHSFGREGASQIRRHATSSAAARPPKRTTFALLNRLLLNRKVSDEYAVPTCRVHHGELHLYGDEA